MSIFFESDFRSPYTHILESNILESNTTINSIPRPIFSPWIMNNLSHEFPQIQEACEQFLLDRITIHNCVSISLYAAQHSCDKLLAGSDYYTR